MSELPKGWIKVTIGDVLQPQSDGKLIHQGWSPRCHTEAADSDNWGVLKTTAIQDGFFLEEHNKKLPEDKEPRERIEVNSGDLLMTNAGPRARCGITTLVRDVRPKLMLSGKMYRMRFNENYIYPRFIEACLRGEKVRAEIDARKTGMSESGLNLTQARFLTVPFLLAPLNEQIRIANKLDSILAKVDKAQARLDKIPAILKRFRQSVLAAATSGELTQEWREEYSPLKHPEVTGKYNLDWSIIEESNLPESWQWVALGNYAKCNRGKFSIRPRNDPSCFDGDYPFIQIGDLPRQGGYIYSHKQTLNEKGYSVSREFDTGTVVLAIVGATIANTGITTYPVCFPDSLVGISSSTDTTNKYLDYHLRAIKENIRQASYAGGGQPNIKLTMVNPLPLPLPPENEIVAIVDKVESLMARANKVEKQYLDAKVRLERLTQSILAKAFRGELVPQDPNDEPAEKLLERILAEKEQSEPKKTTRKRATKAKTAEKE